MSATLYRKHRPLSFADLTGQRHIRITLEQAILSDRVAHAYMFTGPRGVGKTTTARILARAVNCLRRKKTAEPCNQCEACLSILDNRSLDVMEIDAASQTGVDNVRENIIQSARAYPTNLQKKVFIIDEVHMLSLAAFNALLKLLEEPPAHSMFILATTDVHRVPETVISRTQRFDFHRVSLSDTLDRLTMLTKREGRTVDRSILERIARASAGSLRDAESVLGQLFSFPEKDISPERLDMVLPRSDHQAVLDVLEALAPGRAQPAIERFHTFVNEGGDIPTFTRDALTLTRYALLMSVHPQAAADVAALEDEHTITRLGAIVASTSSHRLVDILEALTLALRQLPTATIEELPIEIAIVKLSLPMDTTPVPPTAQSEPAEQASQSAAAKSKSPPAGRSSKKQKSLSLAEAQAAWSQLRNHPDLSPGLALSLKQAQLTSLQGNEMTITVPFALHAERLKTPANARQIQSHLKPILGEVKIQYVVDATAASSSPAPSATAPARLAPEGAKMSGPDDMWDTLVSSFQ